MALTRDQILAKRLDLPREPVDVPQLGGEVFVRVMTAAEKDRFEADHLARKDKLADFRARLVVAVACDADGLPLFTPADVPALGELSSLAIEPVVRKGLAMNGLGGNDALEGAVKN